MKIVNAVFIFSLTLIFCVWISIVANQHNYFFLLTCFFIVIITLYLLLRMTRVKNSWAVFGGVGAISGYLAFVVAAALTQCAERGFSCGGRDVTANLYHGPLLSMGWVYGAMVFALIESSLPSHGHNE